MDELLNKLRDLLRDEITLHESLRQLLARESEEDGEMTSTVLVGVQAKKLECLEQIQHLESLRLSLVQSLADEWGERAEDLTLRKIAAKADSELAEDFLDCHAELRGIVTNIRHFANITAANAHARLIAVEATLAIIHEAIRQHPTYSDAGRLKNKTPAFKVTSA